MKFTQPLPYLSGKDGDRPEVGAGARGLAAAAEVHAGRDEEVQGGHVGQRRLAALPDPAHHAQRSHDLDPAQYMRCGT